MSVLVLGDSHISHLDRFITTHGFAYSNPFRLEPPIPKVILYDISGDRITHRSHTSQLEDQIKYHKPKILIFHIGGNDLDVVKSDSIRVEEIIHRLIALSNYFIQKYSIETVVLPQFMPREV